LCATNTTGLDPADHRTTIANKSVDGNRLASTHVITNVDDPSRMRVDNNSRKVGRFDITRFASDPKIDRRDVIERVS
jgi:hypothetical protein